MYAIIAADGRQYKVQTGDEIQIDLREDAKEGDAITFDNVLLVLGGDVLKVGKPASKARASPPKSSARRWATRSTSRRCAAARTSAAAPAIASATPASASATSSCRMGLQPTTAP